METAGFEYHQHVSRKHAAITRFKRGLRHALTLVIIIIVATLLLNLIQRTSGNYHPNIHEPKDLLREVEGKKRSID